MILVGGANEIQMIRIGVKSDMILGFYRAGQKRTSLRRFHSSRDEIG